MTTIEAIAADQATSVTIARPRFASLWEHYPVKVAASEVYELVGGNAYELYKENPTGYANACALRLSRAFNYGGMEITKAATGYKVKGGDGKSYLLRVIDIIALIRANFGAAEIEVLPAGQNVSAKFKDKTGILIFEIYGWGDASGHVTLWDGSDCGDSCYFTHTQPGTTTVKVHFWELK